ncbi:hypothetical protein JYB87_11150 [Shewanella avicenniae]|uniref:Lipoprotein n=1 Tax=Shewanella avicenniae TaxID=2814294 RepID=A0ABX7QM40_9GAMM|nr:hypothetical protein [Shewanella avicenniae]QSX32329.1 hypothetical protein JYB87_11150 [Shewanella avicenniae]
MKKSLLAIVLLLSGCAATTTNPTYTNTLDVIGAAAATPTGVAGNYTFLVKAVGHDAHRFYLNTETDYRDQRCISIVMSVPVLKQLGINDSPSVERYFLNKRIKVSGIAKRTQIDFTRDGRPTGKYYYQTHIVIERAEQISAEDAT